MVKILPPEQCIASQTLGTCCFGWFCNNNSEEAEFAQFNRIINNKFVVRDNGGSNVYYDNYIVIDKQKDNITT